jgi:hypothetical protein
MPTPSHVAAGTAPASKSPRDKYLELAQQVTRLRGCPLLVLFYPRSASIIDPQIEGLHSILRQSGLSRKTPIDTLDVLLHTPGGEPTTAYRLAQIIRDFALEVNFLVPQYAYSGGTLMCLSADQILLGNHAVLSPIDITLVTSSPQRDSEDGDVFPDENPDESEVELVAIDYFIQVAKQARLEMETAFRQRRWRSSKTDVECALLREMTNQLGVLKIAKYYREKNITQEYAEELLRYMFGDDPSETKTINRIIRSLVVESPSHEFPMDYHICQEIGLAVSEMDEELSDLTREITKTLFKASNDTSLFQVIHGIRFPLFQYVACDVEADEPVVTEGHPVEVSTSSAAEHSNGSENSDIPSDSEREAVEVIASE